MSNERNNEDIVWKHFHNDPFLAKNEKGRSKAKFEKQSSISKHVKEILSTASKNKQGNIGKPEGIITFVKPNDFIIFWEGKADPRNHSSVDLESDPINKAVDGAVHYATKALESGKYKVALALGTSGETENDLKVTYVKMWIEDSVVKKEVLFAPNGQEVDRMLSLDKTLEFVFPKSVEDKRKEDNQNREIIHGLMRKASLSEENKPLVLAVSLVALKDDIFARNYQDYDANELGRQTLNAAERFIKKNDLLPDSEKRVRFMAPYKVIENHQQLHSVGEQETNENNSYYRQILDELVACNILDSLDPDVIGDFYTEFLKYSGGDGKGLGIVLTPHHITEIAPEIAFVEEGTIIIDTCFGTGSFLNSALHKEMSSLTNNENLSKEEFERGLNNIKDNSIVGVELDPKMFTLGATNLLLREVSIERLYEGSCFDPEIINAIQEKDLPKAALINPPYALHKSGGKGEIEFIENATHMVAKGGYVVALVPISTGADSDSWALEVKRRILKNNQLWAVMSLSPDLFAGKAGTIVQLLVFKVGYPHTNEHKTWFADWTDDGYVLKKHVGRDDFNGAWADKKTKWVEDYKNRIEKAGHSVLKHVKAEDEWVTEAYLETDYTTLTFLDFEKKVKDFALFNLSHNTPFNATGESNDHI